MKKRWTIAATSVLFGLVLWCYMAEDDWQGIWDLMTVSFLVEIGRWDSAMGKCKMYLSSMEPEVHTLSNSVEYNKTNTLILEKIGNMYYLMKEYDKALQIYENELIPRVKKNDVEKNLDDFIFYLDQVATLYRKKGEYQQGLDRLQEARKIILSHGQLHFQSLLQFDNLERIKEMRKLVDTVKKQKRYTSTLVSSAKRFHFSKKSVNDDANNADCPTILNKNRFPGPHTLVIHYILWLVFWFSFRFMRKQPRQNLLKRGFITCAFASPFLIIAAAGWLWNTLAEIERINFVAMAMARIGEYERALQLYDEARCEILSNPLDEIILTRETGLDVFMAALWVYNDLRLDTLVDTLSETINELIDAHEVLGPSLVVASYYTALHSVYFNRNVHNLADSYATLAQREWNEILDDMATPPIETMKQNQRNKTLYPDDTPEKVTYELKLR